MSETQAFRTVRYPSKDGLSLAVRDYGDPSDARRAVVCLPGLTRSARDFHELALHLTDHDPGTRVLAFDYRGRGESDHDPVWANYSPAIEAADVLAGLDALSIERAAFVGTSRGGIIVMLIGMMRPAAVDRVVLNDIGPVVEPAGLLRIRQTIGAMKDPDDWDMAVRIMRSQYGSTFPALDETGWQAFARATYRDDSGRPAVDFDPAIARTLDPVPPDQPLPTLWAQFEALSQVPMLVLRGEHSDILSLETLGAMVDRHPNLETLTVVGQGHPPQLRGPDVLDRIGSFLDQT